MTLVIACVRALRQLGCRSGHIAEGSDEVEGGESYPSRGLLRTLMKSPSKIASPKMRSHTSWLSVIAILIVKALI